MSESNAARVRRLSDAARRVAAGDFSVYLAPTHTSDRRDSIDELYEDFNRMVAELGSMETVQNDFAANVSHEIKTPLAVINNNLQLLAGTELTDEQGKYVDAAREGCRRLSGLVFNILKLNKLENQDIVPQPERFDVCRQLADCAIGFEDVWEAKGIEFEADLEDAAWVCADEELLTLVWNNLLSNALKFTEPGGKVVLRQRTEGDCVVVEVADTGCGMAPETAAHIFEKFYQGDTSHAGAGTGLGLALALRVVQLSDAEISVKSVEGEGSTFVVRLPVGAAAGADADTGAEGESGVRSTADVAPRIEAASAPMGRTRYAGYEYAQVEVPEKRLSLYRDSYPCFGWESDPNHPDAPSPARPSAVARGAGGSQAATLHYRRPRTIRNRTELIRLQKNFDALVLEIDRLERSVKSDARRWAWVVALIGTVLLAVSTFAITAPTPSIFVCVLFGVPGLALWVAAYFVHQRVATRRKAQVAPLIEEKYDEMAAVCEKAARLLR